MRVPDLRSDIHEQMATLQSLLNYLEERDQLGAKEYLYCQAQLHYILKSLKRLERVAAAGMSYP
jgi:hypothetical protein